MKTKKVIAVMVSLLLGISLLAGCAGSSSQKNESNDTEQTKEDGSQTAVTDEALADTEKEDGDIDVSDMVTVWSEEDLASIRVRGTLYSIRNFKNNANYVTINMSTPLVEEMGINPEEINSLEAVEELLYRVQKEYPDIYPLVPQASDVMTGTWTWDGLGDSKFLGVLEDCGQSEEVKNLFETDDFIDFCTTMRDWYTNGLIMSDALSNTESGLTLVQNGKAFAYFNNSTPAEIEGIVKAELISAWSKSGTYSSAGYGINANTKYPDESWKLMEALYTDKDIINILVNGIEDVHWVYANEEKTLLTYPDGIDSSSAKYNGGLMYWSFPYARPTIPWAPSLPTFYEDMEEFNNTALKSKGAGMIFDSVNVTNEVTACTNIMAKYYNALMCGTLDVESTIATANEEFKAAGLDLIIAEKQLQLEDAKAATE